MIRLQPTPLDAPFQQPALRPGRSLSHLRRAFVAAPGTTPLLDRLGDPDLLVVTTGQQPGLFTGPLYSVYKALSAAALADRLSERWGRPVLPIFWIAGDDHDHAEAATAWWLAEDGDLRESRLPRRAADAPMRSMSQEPLGTGVEEPLASFLDALPGGGDRDWVTDWLRRHYRPEHTVAGAYAGALAELLAPLGVLCLDSTHGDWKARAQPLIVRALEEAGALDRELRTIARARDAAGESTAVSLTDGATLVFLDDRLGRDRLVIDGAEFRTRRGSDTYSLDALRALAASAPERFSPNVLLRPVVESALLPTVAYLGGPGELQYLGLTPSIYRILDVPRQTPLPRWSGIIVEPHSTRLLTKFGLVLDDLAQADGTLERRILRGRLPTEVTAALDAFDAAVAQFHDRVAPAAHDLDPTLDGPVRAARRRLEWAVRDLERKLLRRLRDRDAVELAQLRRLRGTLRPAGKPQERVLTIAPFLARHGRTMLRDIRMAADDFYRGALEAAAREA